MNAKIEKAVLKLKNLNRKQIAVGCGIALACTVGLYGLVNLFDKPIINSAEQVSSLASNVRKFYQNRPDGWGISSESAVKNNLIPQEMLKNGKIVNKLGKDVFLGADKNGSMVMPGMRSFVVVYKDLNYRECILIAQKSLSEDLQLVLNNLVLDNSKGEKEFIWGGKNSLPITSSAAKEACEKKNNLIWSINL